MIAALLGALLLPQAPDTCLLFSAENLARGNGNWYLYYEISNQQTTIKKGDVLDYDIYIDPTSPVWKAAVDINWTDDSTALRDLGAHDQNGLRAHGDGVLQPASGKWYSRHIPLEEAVGKTTADWELVFEGDVDGRYTMLVDNLQIRHADGTKTTIYDSGPAPHRGNVNANGYSKRIALSVVERSKVVDNMDLKPLFAQAIADAKRFQQIDELRSDIDLVRQYVERNPDPQLMEHVKEAEALLAKAEKDSADAEVLQQAIHAAKHALSHTHPAMTSYTGHLVGHAHIDLQWLWEWQEGIVSARDTFNQACNFMEEFKGFSFSQSSSCLYQATEQHYPDLFKRIQQKVKAGQWEIVGGRVCEGDTNMISPESHARQFLYGQAYFKEKFGKRAVVGWEPDTFGHTIQMPQILKLGGCDYYYFCRGGKGKPLFWWQGLDGSRVLAFDEPATGSWYNSDISYQQFQEMLDFEKKTGSKDMLWVYGVGNHGGGPTREHIETALEMMKAGYLPNVKFSTATQFFKKLETYDLKKIPVVDQELNPVFDGCYTSHAEVKKLNRDAEAMTTSAEATAATASLFGFAYPHESFRRNWEDICINHHHDTLPGSGIHAPYENTKIMLNRVISDDRDIINRAMQLMSLRVTPKKGGISVMAFNPTGFVRSGWVQTLLVQSGWDGGERLNPSSCAAFSPDGKVEQVDVLDRDSHLGRFYASDIPAFGYKVFQIKNAKLERITVSAAPDGSWAENENIRVEFDRNGGFVSKIIDKASGRVMNGAVGRLENYFEKPEGMSAWTIGHIDHVERWPARECVVKKNGAGVDIEFHHTIKSVNSDKEDTTVTQTFHIWPHRSQIDVDVDCDWQHVGKNTTPNPALRAAFETNLANPSATYEVPFGALSRPVDDGKYGGDFPALKWVDLSDANQGLAIFNDSKHGFAANGSTMRMTLIRSSFDPDPVPNPGQHHWRYSIWSHGPSVSTAEFAQKGTEFNQGLESATVPFDARGAEPLEWSPVSIQAAGFVPTCLKLAEGSSDLVLRGYEGAGNSAIGTIKFARPFAGASWVNFLEDKIGAANVDSSTVKVQLHKFQIATLRVKQK